MDTIAATLYAGKTLSIRPLTHTDADLLVKWLSDPDVLAYYEGRDRPHDLAMVQEHYYDRAGNITGCIVQYNEEAIGYMQFYVVEEEERQAYGYEGFAGNLYGMDQFIGETPYWNKGIGTALIAFAANYLMTSKQADKIVMDPQAWNARALRAYEKCGFVKKAYLPEHEWHEGAYRDCWLIELERQPAGGPDK
ncbi:GNAT family N-acetyltransferase [Paenibacillus hodogayensis]|uniref:GNAT family N-acetyltransferase n=1 Tax=Paenibacillus hodogayensis TaxID=279208 RepID=UPI0031EA864A